MPKESFIITSNCRFEKKWYQKGAVVQLDDEDQLELIAMLNRNGRLAPDTKQNREKIDLEIAAEKAHEKRIADQVAAFNAGPTNAIASAVASAVTAALSALGLIKKQPAP